MPELPIAIRGYEYGKTTWDRRWVPWLTYSAELDCLYGHALGQSIYCNHYYRHRPTRGERHLVRPPAFGASLYAEDGLASGVSDFLEFLHHLFTYQRDSKACHVLAQRRNWAATARRQPRRGCPLRSLVRSMNFFLDRPQQKSYKRKS